jgi:hypothetical protein
MPCYCVAAQILTTIRIPTTVGFSVIFQNTEIALGTRKSGKGRRKQGRKKRRMRSKIRHRKK